MSHTATLAIGIVFITTTHLFASENQDNSSSNTSQVIADYVNSSSGLNVKGTITHLHSQKTAKNPSGFPVLKFTYTDVSETHISHSFMHTRATARVKEGIIAEVLNTVPDLTPLRNRLFIEKQSDDPRQIANFNLHVISRVDGYISDRSNDTQERIDWHEQRLRTTGFATVILLPKHDFIKIEDYQLFLSILSSFSTLAKELGHQSIWVTVKMNDQTKYGLCWPEGWDTVDPMPQ